MKTMKVVPLYLRGMFFLGLFALVLACSEEKVEVVSEQDQVDLATQSSEAENITDEELDAIDEALALSPEGGRAKGSTCAVVTRNESAKTITIDFGDGCVGPRGRERSGKIIITYGGDFDDDLANRIISFDNYFVDNKNITGTIELRDVNRNDDGQLSMTRKRINLTVHFPDGNTFTSNGSTTLTWLEGEGDEDRTNDVWQLTGSFEGVSSRGRVITHEIIEPVIISFSCREEGGFARVSGKIEMTMSMGDQERVKLVDYGDGSCDNVITITVNDKTFTVTIG